MKKEKKCVWLIVSCLMVLSLTVLLLPPVIQAQEEVFGPGFIRWKEDPGYRLPPGIIVEKDVPVPMRDGVKLRANVYRPDKPGKFPVIMSFTPYHKDLSGWTKGWGEPDPEAVKVWESACPGEPKGWGTYSYRVSEETSFEAADVGFWVPYDYAVILVDNRGYHKSEGQRLGYRAGEDQYDGIEWAAKQEWCDGNIGMSGVSALGICQWYAAQLHPPHLKAIVPWAARTHLPTPYFGGIPEYGFYGSIAILAKTPLNPALGQSIPKKRPPQRLVFENIQIPALVCATWGDQEVHTRGTIWAYQKISSEYKWLYTHGRQKWHVYYSPESKAMQKQFFDCFLKGMDSTIMHMPRVRLEVRETIDKYSVRYEAGWPIPRTRYKELYLDAVSGTLNFDEVSQQGKVSYDSADGRAIFNIKFDQDTELTGHMKLKLWVSPEEADDMDLFIALRKFDAHGNEVKFHSCHTVNGESFPVALGWLRLSNRELDEKKSTPWQPILKFGAPQKVEPGQIVPCEVEIYPSGTLFRAGETLRLVISGKYEGETTRFKYKDLNEGKHTIYAGGEYGSYLLIPVIPPRGSRLQLP